jgi:hypothetical protein
MMAGNGVRDRVSQPDGAVQYLIWALEEIERIGHRRAALYARMTLGELRGVRAGIPNRYDEEAKRFRDKAEQLVELAKTTSSREPLVKIAESYRVIAEHMERVSKTQTPPTNRRVI